MKQTPDISPSADSSGGGKRGRGEEPKRDRPEKISWGVQSPAKAKSKARAKAKDKAKTKTASKAKEKAKAKKAVMVGRHFEFIFLSLFNTTPHALRRPKLSLYNNTAS